MNFMRFKGALLILAISFTTASHAWRLGGLSRCVEPDDEFTGVLWEATIDSVLIEPTPMPAGHPSRYRFACNPQVPKSDKFKYYKKRTGGTINDNNITEFHTRIQYECYCTDDHGFSVP